MAPDFILDVRHRRLLPVTERARGHEFPTTFPTRFQIRLALALLRRRGFTVRITQDA